jgi:capsid assembly protease
MTQFAQLASRIFNRPLAIRPERAEIAVAAIGERLGIVSIQGPSRRAGDWYGDDDELAPRQPLPGYTNVGGIAVIPVHGTLVSRLGGMEPYCGMTGYNQVRGNLMLALADPMVRAVAFDVDSPGGEVDGCFDLVDAIHAARGQKPIWAICADHAYSAAYAIASAADRVTVPRTGGTGSVGVITMLVDMSAALKEAGLTVHFVTHGARKAEEGRAQYQGVKPELLGRIQAEIDAVGEIFVATVARNRGADAGAIRALEAACLMGGDGVAAGLADDVMAPADAFAALLASLPQAA